MTAPQLDVGDVIEVEIMGGRRSLYKVRTVGADRYVLAKLPIRSYDTYFLVWNARTDFEPVRLKPWRWNGEGELKAI